MSTTQISPETKEWYRTWKAEHGQKQPRAFDVNVPRAAVDKNGFLLAAERRAFATNQHSHSHTCRKGFRGRFICRLARPAGIHAEATQPLHIRQTKASDLCKRRQAEFRVNPIGAELAGYIDALRDYSDGRVVQNHIDGAIIWEQTRLEEDAMFVETNLPLACLTAAHTNSAILCGKDAGDMVEEYQQSYMTKEKGSLKSGTAVMLTALSDIEAYPSVADDHGTYLRQAKHLATRTVNAFTGATEWPHALMVYALAGHRSFQSSDTFWYVFPHKLVEYICGVDGETHGRDSNGSDVDSTSEAGESTLENEYINQDDTETMSSRCESECGDQNENIHVNEALEMIVAAANDDSVSQQVRGGTYSSGGARMFKVAEEIVLVTQAESYRYRGNWFEAYSPLEFEVIVDLLPRCDNLEPDEVTRGRPKRRGYDLAPNHPLSPHFQGFIRTKFKTAMLGGPPPPSFPKNGRPSSALSKYVLALLHPWSPTTGVLPFQPTPRNLVRVCGEWNSINGSFLNQQRYKVMENIFEKHHRSSRNEKSCSEWRSRNADRWETPTPKSTSAERQRRHEGSLDGDPEATGTLEAQESYELTKAASAKHRDTVIAVRVMRATFWSLIPELCARDRPDRRSERTIYQDHLHNELQLSKIAKGIHAMTPPTRLNDENQTGRDQHSVSTPLGGMNGPSDPLAGPMIDEARQQPCPSDQQRVFDKIMGSVEGGEKLRQTLTVLHGGGGTGKSTLIRRITDKLSAFGIHTVSTCPTGVGASQLENGKAIHSAFKVFRKTELSPNDLELLRLTFTERVWLIVVDDVSMLSAEHLSLIDARLRAIYKNNLNFGGRSLILAGDFLQLDVTGGTALCKLLYRTVTSSHLLAARALFRKFKVCFLTQQHRAAGCQIQMANLLACRSLPAFYPSGLRYTAEEMRNFRSFTADIAKTISRVLTADDIANDLGWLDEMTLLVTNNLDKAVLTACAARLYARRNGETLFRWRRDTKMELPIELQNLVYDEDCHPELFAYFVKGAPAQILDNNNGNVGWSIANGTPCKMCLSGDGSRPHKKSVIIPIGLTGPQSRKSKVRLGVGVLDKAVDMEFIQRGVDLAFVMTVWKAQGSTLKRVVLNLEPIRSTAPKWDFEHLYVGMSRVTAAKYLRCLPLTGVFRVSKIENLRPNIYTTRWRLDHQRDN